MRLGLGYIEVYKRMGREVYVSGPHLRATRTVYADLLVSDSKNTGFTRTLDLVAQLPYGSLPAYLALGTGTQPKSPSNPYLDAEIIRVPRAGSAVVDAKNTLYKLPVQYWWVREHTYTLTPTNNLTVSEWGVSESSIANTPLVAGGLFPEPITLNAQETYVFRYRTLAEFTSESSGVMYYTISQSVAANLCEYFLTGATQVTIAGFTYDLQAVSNIISTPTVGTYNPGSYLRTYTFSTSERDSFVLRYSNPASGEFLLYNYKHPAYYPYYNTTRTVYVRWAPTSDF